MSLPPEAHIVDNPVHFPQCCELCLGQKGPMVDTMVDRPSGPQGGGGSIHLYVCRPCAKDICELHGFAKGAKLDKLMNAAEERDAMEKRVLKAEADARKMADALTDEKQRHTATARQLEAARDREHQQLFLAQQIGSNVNEFLVLANGG